MANEMNLDDWSKRIYKCAKEHGWWEERDLRDGNVVAALLCLIHSEVSEALEARRDGDVDMVIKNGKPEGMVTELGDALIRILDLDAALRDQGITTHSVFDAVRVKVEYNEGRSYKHGGKAL